MTIHVKKLSNGFWRWAVTGEDERIPLGVGLSVTERGAHIDAQYAIEHDWLLLPIPYAWNSWTSVVYPVGDVWRWVVIILGRPIYGGACDTYEFAECQTFYATQHAYRPWGDYDRPYTEQFAGGELLDPLTVNAQEN